MIYNRKPASCLAMQFTGDNTTEMLDFLNKHTEGVWNIQSPDGVNDYYTAAIENPLWSKAKFLIKSSWVVIHSESRVEMMSDSNFKSHWELIQLQGQAAKKIKQGW